MYTVKNSEFLDKNTFEYLTPEERGEGYVKCANPNCTKGENGQPAYFPYLKKVIKLKNTAHLREMGIVKMSIITQRKSTKMKWQHNWKTSIELKILAYAQKIVTIALATYLAYGFLYPVLKKSIDIPGWLLGSSIIFTLLVFELIFHFAFLDFVQGLFEKRIEWMSLIGATFILVVIAALGWFSTENLAYFRTEVEDKIQLINIDSLQNLKRNELSVLEKSYLEKEKGVDSLHLPLLKKAQDYPYLFIKAEKAYRESKDKLIKDRDKARDFTRRKWEREIASAKESNQARISKVEKEDLADARSTSWISLVILFLSIYPSFVVAVYKMKI